MFESPHLFDLLTMRGPMSKQQLREERIRNELAEIRAEVDRLKAKSAEYHAGSTARFDRYLDILEQKRTEVRDLLASSGTPDAAANDKISERLNEAKQRLAIAKLAARSRFH